MASVCLVEENYKEKTKKRGIEEHQKPQRNGQSFLKNRNIRQMVHCCISKIFDQGTSAFRCLMSWLVPEICSSSIDHESLLTTMDLLYSDVLNVWLCRICNRGNSIINLPFGDGLYHPFMVILGMAIHDSHGTRSGRSRTVLPHSTMKIRLRYGRLEGF
jgi:hypothetical protein